MPRTGFLYIAFLVGALAFYVFVLGILNFLLGTGHAIWVVLCLSLIGAVATVECFRYFMGFLFTYWGADDKEDEDPIERLYSEPPKRDLPDRLRHHEL